MPDEDFVAFLPASGPGTPRPPPIWYVSTRRSFVARSASA